MSSRKNSLSFLLLNVLLFAAIGICHATHLHSHVVQKSSLLHRLHVPQLTDNWEIDALFNGYRVQLKLPQQLELIDKFPQQIQSIVWQKIQHRQKNIEVLRNVAKEFDEILTNSLMIHPAQHEQTLEHVVMSLPPHQRNNQTSPITLHEPILDALPDYAEVDIFLPENSVSRVSSRLLALGMEQRVKLHGVQEVNIVENSVPLHHRTTRWTRDLFWNSADEDGRSLLVLPLAFYQINDLSRSDNAYVHKLESEKHRVARVPLFFKGGNLLVGVANGRRVLFVGEDELILNNEFYYNAFFYHPPKNEVLELLKEIAGAEEVRILPNSEHLFHLDMVMAVLNTGVVAVINTVDDEMIDDDRRVISEVRQALKEYDFKIVDVPTTSDWVNNFKSPVNIVPFTDRNNGKLSAIVPHFPDTMVTINGKSHSLQQIVKQAYVAAGVEPLFVSSNFHQFNGNIHCAILPLK